VNRSDILAFVGRDWARLAESKSAAWIERKRGLSPEQVLAIGDQLRLYAQALRPGWPTSSERDAALATHLRVTGALRAVPSQSR
jgi:hypothetical protein